jgi:hypothetical protein
MKAQQWCIGRGVEQPTNLAHLISFRQRCHDVAQEPTLACPGVHAEIQKHERDAFGIEVSRSRMRCLRDLPKRDNWNDYCQKLVSTAHQFVTPSRCTDKRDTGHHYAVQPEGDIVNVRYRLERSIFCPRR